MLCPFIGREITVKKRFLSSMKVTIGKKGQITIPWLLRQVLWCQPGDELQIEIKKVGCLVIENPTPHYPAGHESIEAEHRRKYAIKYGLPLPSPAAIDPQKIAVQKVDSSPHHMTKAPSEKPFIGLSLSLHKRAFEELCPAHVEEEKDRAQYPDLPRDGRPGELERHLDSR